MCKRIVAALATALITLNAQAATLTVGEPLPTLNIIEIGECVLVGDATGFQPWSSTSLLGEVQVLEYVAARAGVGAINQPFYAALTQAGLAVPVTKVVNSSDALWGTSGLVVGKIEQSRKENPDVALVVDAQGLGQAQWELAKKTATLVILDAQGKVMFFKQGEMTGEEVKDAVALIQTNLPFEQ